MITKNTVLIALTDVAIKLVGTDLVNQQSILDNMKSFKKSQAEIDAQQKKVNDIRTKLGELNAERAGYEEQLCIDSANQQNHKDQRQVLLDELRDL